MKYTLREVKKAIRPKVFDGDLDATIKGVSIDSRTVKKGDMFIAIKGQTFNGHDFIVDAVKKGAKAVVVSKKIKKIDNVAIFQVEDTTRSLGRMACFHRKHFTIPIIAVTGSAGKTTTKEMVAGVLKSKYNVLKSEKSFNNQYGVPLTLLRLNERHEMCVLEVGTNQPGDISFLAHVSQPNYCVLTNIGESHLKLLKDKKGVFHEKFQLVKYLGAEGYVFFNRDDEYLAKIEEKKFPKMKICYSIDRPSNYQAEFIERKNNKILFKLGRTTITLNTVSKHNVYNALAAICCGRFFDVNYNNITINLNKCLKNDQRQNIIKAGKITIIDDSYNSNPVSFKSAIETLSTIKTKGKRICVCADMLELGKNEKKLHDRMGKFIVKSNIDFVLSFGRLAKNITSFISKIDDEIDCKHFTDMKKLKQYLKKIVKNGDVVLVKGSRAMEMERVVEFLTKKL